jgi:hypothetical protein
VRVVDAAVDDPLAKNFRDDLANPLRADGLLAGDLVIRPAFSEPRGSEALSANDCWRLCWACCLKDGVPP